MFARLEWRNVVAWMRRSRADMDVGWRGEFARIVRFALVGILNTALSLGTIYLLQNGLGVDYRAANAIGYALGIITSFVLNRIWTDRMSRSARGDEARCERPARTWMSARAGRRSTM